MTSGARFPAGISDNYRYFVDQAGEPWFGRGDTAWSLIGQLGPLDVDRYLSDRAARGFNLVLVNVLEHYYSSLAPRNYDNDAPFTDEPFRSAPSEAYWSHVDYVVQAAQVRGITVLLCPAYLGAGVHEGWSKEITSASNEDMADYGSFLRDRYGDFPNVMWLIGHDRVPNDVEKARMESLAAELQPGDLVGLGGNQEFGVLGTPLWNPTSIVPDFETVYSYQDRPVDDVGGAWAAHPTRPVMFLEGKYEQENSALPGDMLLRRQEYGALTAGAAAVIFGNNPIWHFESMPLFPYEGTWRENLASLGTRDAQHLGSLVRTLPWWEMQPDTAGDLLVEGGADDDPAAVRYAGSHALVYIPTAQTVVLDLSRLSAVGRVDLRRIDPRSGDGDLVARYRTAGRISIQYPGQNAAGAEDWVYVLLPAT